MIFSAKAPYQCIINDINFTAYFAEPCSKVNFNNQGVIDKWAPCGFGEETADIADSLLRGQFVMTSREDFNVRVTRAITREIIIQTYF